MDPISNKIKKWLYLIIGTVSLAAGVLGMFLPVIPTTPFVLLSAACYYRSSSRIYDWLVSSRHFGTTIRNYESGRGLRRSTKIKAIGLMWASITLSAYFFVSSWLVVAGMYVVAVAVSAYLFRLPTVPELSSY